MVANYNESKRYAENLRAVADQIMGLDTASIDIGYKVYRDAKSLVLEAANAIDNLNQAFVLCRNELCLKCGQYKSEHLGACDGCSFKVTR